jgi:hypothetical protein
MRLAGLCLAVLPCLASAATGCGGGLDSDTATPTTLATVSGTITNPQSLAVVSDALRVAVVWDAAGQALPDGSYATDHRTSQDIKVTSAFPVSFALKLADLPTDLQPFSELFGSTGKVDLRGTAGFVIAYEDTNENGKLDLVTASSGAFVDKVLGSATSPLLYLEGAMPTDTSLLANAADSAGHFPTRGFNLRVSYCVSGKTPPAGRRCEDAYDWVTVGTPITLALTGEAKLADIMCQELPSSSNNEVSNGHEPGELPVVLPVANDPTVTCTADGRGFTIAAPCTTTSPPGICQASTTTCRKDAYVLAATASAPGGWPCTVR